MFKKAQQHFHFPRLLKKYCVDEKLLVCLLSLTESMPAYCVTAWSAGCSAADKRSYPQGNKDSMKAHWLRSSLLGRD